jgi:hypothetical protein
LLAIDKHRLLGQFTGASTEYNAHGRSAKPAVHFANENTDAGAMARLFINEAAGPHAFR